MDARAQDHSESPPRDRERGLPLPARARRSLEDRLVPTEYEKRSCAGMGPRIRAMWISEARQNPKVVLGDNLSSAAAAGDAEKVQSLLEQGADPNHVHDTICFDVPLARTSSVQVAKALLAHPNIRVNVKDINNYSILCSMVLHHGDKPDLVAALLAHPELVPDGKALQTAVRFSCLEVIQLLLAHPGFHLNDSEVGVLHSAMSRTKPDATGIFAWLLSQSDLDANLKLKENGATALHRASQMDSLCVEIGQTERGVKTAIAKGQAERLQMLLQRPDLDVNAVDTKGATPLHWYASAGRLDLVRILIADPRVLPSLWHHNADGLSPAEVAASERDRPRERWAPAPLLAQYQEVIDMLERSAEEHKQKLEGIVPAELANHPGTWSMAVRSL